MRPATVVDRTIDGASGRSKAYVGLQRPAGDADRRLPALAHRASGRELELLAVPRHDDEVAGTYIERCWSGLGCTGVGDGTVSDASLIARPIWTRARSCVHVTATRRRVRHSAPDNMVRIHRRDFMLRDLVDPVLTGTPSGDLIDTTQPLTGVRSASFSASDQGGGVYQALLEVDGRRGVNGRGRQRRKLCSAVHGAVPCKPSTCGTLSFDTRRSPTARTRCGLSSRTRRAPIGGLRTGAGHAQPDGGVRSTVTPRHAVGAHQGLASERRDACAGRGTVTGRITGAGAGAVVTCSAGSGGRARGGRGRDNGHRRQRDVRLPVPPALRGGCVAGWRTAAGPRFGVLEGARLRVPARATLARPRRASGSRVRLSGRLLGGRVPARGKLIDLQGDELGRWRSSPPFAPGRPASSRRATGSAPARRSVPDACPGAPGRRVSVRGRLLAGGAGPRAMSARDLPPVDALAAQVDAPRALAVAAARAVLAERRAELLGGSGGRGRPRRPRAGVGRGGRAPVAAAGDQRDRRDRAHEPRAGAAGGGGARGGRGVAVGYGNLELDLATGARGSRHAHVEALLCELTGAEAGLGGQQRRGGGAARGRGARRARQGGRRLARAARRDRRRLPGAGRDRPGGRTARRGGDDQPHAARRLRAAIWAPDTGAVLRVHQSNFRQLGFVEDVPIEALCELGVPVIDDVGSGALGRRCSRRADRAPLGRGRRGARLLLGRQAARRAAGGAAGRARAMRSRRHGGIRSPARCGSTSSRSPRWRRRCAYTGRAASEIPVLAMLARRASCSTRAPRARGADRRRGDRRHRARRRRRAAAARAPGAGRRAGRRLAAAALRAGDPPVLGRVEGGRLLLDPRTLTDDEDRTRRRRS